MIRTTVLAALSVSVLAVALTAAAGRENLADKDGSAIVIHANADDHRAQPIGGAGGRIACGVIAGG